MVVASGMVRATQRGMAIVRSPHQTETMPVPEAFAHPYNEGVTTTQPVATGAPIFWANQAISSRTRSTSSR